MIDIDGFVHDPGSHLTLRRGVTMLQPPDKTT